ncbi:MAG TPA: hypothetical protein VK687_09305 [Bryobacteraceae bacterium]|nr:hypothetical protein [Bryobacteraceae bacterium]
MTYYAAFLCLSAAASAAVAQDGTASVDAQSQAALASDTSAINTQDRLRWILKSTLGPRNLAAGLFVSGWGTWHNEPHEYGPHWEGYGKRYGLRLTVGGTSNVIEASLGSVWGEDPRYRRAEGQPVGRRLAHVFVSTFVTHDLTGNPMPAYARYIAVPSGNIISNMWRPDSQTTFSKVGVHVGLGFLSRIVGNAFSEFFPDLREHAFQKKRAALVPPSAAEK